MNKIILADNQAIFRAGIAKVLASEEDFRVAAQCADLVVDDDPAGVLDRLAGTHLICDRTDPADPSRDVGQLGV